MTQASERDGERDAYLREALRHAPDAALGPPAALSNAILRQARSATTAPAARAAGAQRPGHRSRRRVLDDLWSWLARPVVAAGFASVIAATLVGMMWWDRPMDDAVPQRPDLPAAAPARRAPPVVAAPETLAPETPAAPPVATVPKRETPVASKSVAAGSVTSTEALPREAHDRAKVSTAAPAPAREPEQLAKDTEATLRRAAPQPFPGSSESASEEAMRQRQQAAAPSAKKERATAAAAMAERPFDQPPSNSAGAAQVDSARPVEPPAARLAGRFDAQPGPSPLGALRAALAEQPQRWTWAREDGSAQPLDAALQAWLARLDDATVSPGPQGNAKPGAADEARGNLQAARRDAEGTDASAAPQVLRLLRDGRLHTTLRLRSQAVQVDTIDAPAPRWQAPLAPSAGAVLKASMPGPPR
ncbi:MAG TPA: hypothetical protein VF308_02155 [Caldimonas sp.]